MPLRKIMHGPIFPADSYYYCGPCSQTSSVSAVGLVKVSPCWPSGTMKWSACTRSSHSAGPVVPSSDQRVPGKSPCWPSVLSSSQHIPGAAILTGWGEQGGGARSRTAPCRTALEVKSCSRPHSKGEMKARTVLASISLVSPDRIRKD